MIDAPKKGKRVLCTWEIGGELGHISSFAKIVKALEAEGYEVFVALKDLSRAYPFFCDTRAILLQAPTWLPSITMQRPIACLADTLLLLGYLETDPLHSLVLAWQNLVDLVKPDLLMFNYSPTAMLAVLQQPLPKILTGTGFADPVPGHPIVDWRPYSAQDDLIARQELRVLQQINAVLARQGKPALTRLADLFAADRVLISTFPELDLYRHLRDNASYCLSHSPQLGGVPARFASNGQARILVYLKPNYPQIELLIAALASCSANVFIACPQGRPEQFQSLISDRFQVSVGLVSLQEAMAEADLFICHGNCNSLTESLIAGTPALVLPIQLEQLLTGKNIQTHGMGLLLEQLQTAEALTAILEQMLRERDLYKATIARVLAQYPEPRLSLAAGVSAACGELLGG